MKLLVFLVLVAVPGFWPVQAEEGIFVAVGYGGRRISSHDGLSWENDTRWSDVAADDDNVLFNVAYGLGRFIAVGGGAKLGRIVTTTDGKEWKELAPLKGRVATIAFTGAPGGNRFIAAHDGELLWSVDGETFNAGEKLPIQGSIHARKAACGDTEAGFMTVTIGDVDLWAEKTRVSWRGVTADGEKWTSHAVDTPAARAIAYGAGHFVVVGPNALVETSHDGQNWRSCETAADEDFQSIIWTGRAFLAKGKKCWMSDDGLSWKPDSRMIAGEPVFGRDGVGGISCSWGGNIFFSRDFGQWKKCPLPAGPSFNAATWGSR